MTSKLLDFVRPGRKSNVAIHAEALAATETAAQVPLPVDEATLPAHGVQGHWTTLRSRTGSEIAKTIWSAAAMGMHTRP